MAKIYKIVLLFLIAALLPLTVDAASLSFYPASGSYNVGSSFTVGVYVSSSDQSINAASGVISFPTDMLEVSSISKNGSIFTIWADEPSYSNGAGTVSFEGLVPNPGFIGSSGKIITITFRVKSTGTPSLRFSSASTLANDGRGTNVIKGIGTAQFTLGIAAAPAVIKADKEKPSYFDVVEIVREDETDPRAQFVFKASDDIGIDHYVVKIDNVDIGDWKGDESGVYKAPPYGPGTHTIIVKAVDKAGNSRSSTETFFIKGLEAPTFTEYPKNLQSGEILSVEGNAKANGEVRIWLEKRKGELQSFVVKSDENGRFTFASDEGMTDGVFDLWAEVSDERGARSLPTDKYTIAVSESPLLRFGGLAINILSILIPLVVLVFGLLFALLYGWHKFSIYKKKLRKEIHQAESVLHKSFSIMRREVKEGIEILERADLKRTLTKEESKILKQFKENLVDTEKFIADEIDDIEKLV